MKDRMRWEKDSLGELSVPADVYYGIHTLRSARNFPISGIRNPTSLLTAVVHIKKAAAETNRDLGRLDALIAGAIEKACDNILEGGLRDQFIVDVFQMGAGTSFHMNCNEVIANRAEEILGGIKGEYKRVHPNDHVNMGQSTNDVFPTAMRLAVLSLLKDSLQPALLEMEDTFRIKAEEFDDVVKSGRTHLQDAAPIRLGQEFKAYAEALRRGRIFLDISAESLLYLGIGGSAVGTGLNTSEEYAGLMVSKLSTLTGFPLVSAEDLREAMQSMQPMTEVAAALRNLAIELNRIANDLRLLASGPMTGLAEIVLPAVAPGSSAMPGKVNPSMLEMLNMVCYQLIGCDLVISGAAQAGQLELNVMMPVIIFNLDFMIRILSNALKEVRARCIESIEANAERCRLYAEQSTALVTALSPALGYQKAAELADKALSSGKTLREIIVSEGLLTGDELEAVLDPKKMTEPGALFSPKRNKS
ncbi:MAG: aspartate ammonia-lyase [Candidatus Aminicenantes bacterium]|nr:aspartate ammonia-lyase [Candidatus Aminicenantes bacterium]